MATRRRLHPLLAASTLLPVALGVASSQFPSAQPQVKVRPGKVQALKLSCNLPFDAIKQIHPIDGSCAATGNAKLPDARAQQNAAKNNFCNTGTPVNVDFDVMHQLQQDAEDRGISFGSDAKIPEDRTALAHLPTKAGSIGEGTVARLAAYVIKAHYSNVGKGESVNCNQPDKESNDIHIVLGEKSNHDDECSSLTAEMSPHFRPLVWDDTNLVDNNEHLYRFTGQLFFDASHRPCSGGKGSPKRSAIWEIHPVYGVDICIDPNNDCKVDGEANWVSLSDWVGGEATHETRLRIQNEIPDYFQSSTNRRPEARAAPWE
jgi:hypothetical protein